MKSNGRLNYFVVLYVKCQFVLSEEMLGTLCGFDNQKGGNSNEIKGGNLISC